MAEWENLFEPEDKAFRKAMDKAMYYISLRDHSSGELYQKLCQKLEDKQSAAAAVARCNELGLLNDEAFARHRAKYLVARGKSPRQIKGQLQEKGISRELAASVVEELCETIDPADTVEQLVRKSYLHKLENGKRDTVVAALARRGFAYADIKEGVARCEAELELEPEVDFDFEG